ncbi:DUF680 domain-containing protein [Mesorhizobium sp. NPDC059054]|uniref:DUF680 domain-containing protein n=1 Tax=unclassified Mesorhizobium TaxID=325217 RepID=UPI0006C753E1|nr:DUF680 domain-containing protein [Mesorhizobium sp. 1M-11]
MKTIALTAAALLVAAGTAFAGSDHYGSNFTYSNVDSSYTASIKNGSASSQETAKTITDGAPRLGGNS